MNTEVPAVDVVTVRHVNMMLMFYLPVFKVPWTIYEILVTFSYEKKLAESVHQNVDIPIAVIDVLQEVHAIPPPRYSTMVKSGDIELPPTFDEAMLKAKNVHI